MTDDATNPHNPEQVVMKRAPRAHSRPAHCDEQPSSVAIGRKNEDVAIPGLAFAISSFF